MDDTTFNDLLTSAEQARDHAQGKLDLRTTLWMRRPPAISAATVKRVRHRLHASQAVFAKYLNVSPKLVQAWEANRRKPAGPALLLLHIAKKQPQIIESLARASFRMRSPHERAVRPIQGKAQRARRGTAARKELRIIFRERRGHDGLFC